MKLLEVKTIKCGDKEFPIKITTRAQIEFEALSGGSISSLEGTAKVVQLFYCAAKAGARSEGKEFTYTYDTFLDAIDDYYFEIMTGMAQVLTSVAEGRSDKKK
jgi:hypothetical protein